VSFEAFTAVMFQVEVFWVVTPCNVVVGYQRFRDPCCLCGHPTDGHGDVGILAQHCTAS